MSIIDEDDYMSQISSDVEAGMEWIQELPDSSEKTEWTSPSAPGTPHSTGVAQRRPWPLGQFKTQVVKPIMPFLTTLYLRAQLIHQMARNVHVFHMQSIYLARQALHLVILLNDAVDANEGPSDEQDDERNDLEDELIELSNAMNEWGSDKGEDFDYERQAVEIEQQYTQLFKERSYFHDARDCSADPLYQRFVAYDAKTIRYRQLRETHISPTTIEIDCWTETVEDESGSEDDTGRRFGSTIGSLSSSRLGQHVVEGSPVSELYPSMHAFRAGDDQSAWLEHSEGLAPKQSKPALKSRGMIKKEHLRAQNRVATAFRIQLAITQLHLVQIGVRKLVRRDSRRWRTFSTPSRSMSLNPSASSASMLFTSPTIPPEIAMISSSSSPTPGTVPASPHSIHHSILRLSIPWDSVAVEARNSRDGLASPFQIDAMGPLLKLGRRLPRNLAPREVEGNITSTAFGLDLPRPPSKATLGWDRLPLPRKDCLYLPLRDFAQERRAVGFNGFADSWRSQESIDTTTYLGYPPPTPHYVERREPMRFMEEALFDQNGATKPGPRILVITGLGGCGKTQLVRKFVEQHGNKFVTASFIDGSGKEIFQRDLIRHVRSFGTAHSQKSFEDSIKQPNPKLLSQPCPDGKQILIIDNVDDPPIDLALFLSRWPNGTVIVTSRNRSLGKLGSSHLELDVMSQEESVELLVRGSGRVWPPSKSDEEAAIAVLNELGRLPIALVQALHHMETTGCPKITLFQTFPEPSLNDHAMNQVEIRCTRINAAFDASPEMLNSNARWMLHFHEPTPYLRLDSTAAEFLPDNSYFAPSPVPFVTPYGEELERGEEFLGATYCSSGNWEPLAVDSLPKYWQNHSLVALVPIEEATSVLSHPLMQERPRFIGPGYNRKRIRDTAIRLQKGRKLPFGVLCGKTVPRQDCFKHHVQTHFGLKPYACADSRKIAPELKCDRTFSSLAERDTHVRNKVPVACTCTKEMKPKNLARHKKICQIYLASLDTATSDS